jgi:hypothetical protein
MEAPPAGHHRKRTTIGKESRSVLGRWRLVTAINTTAGTIMGEPTTGTQAFARAYKKVHHVITSGHTKAVGSLTINVTQQRRRDIRNERNRRGSGRVDRFKKYVAIYPQDKEVRQERAGEATENMWKTSKNKEKWEKREYSQQC